MSDEKNWPIAIDPPGCGCTECIIGQYVPIDRATDAQVTDLMLGILHNNLHNDELPEVSVTTEPMPSRDRVWWFRVTSATATLHGMTWTLDHTRFSLMRG